MDRHCATRRLRRLAEMSVVRLPRMHPHLLRHTIVKVQGGEEAGGLDLEEDLAVVEPVDVFVLGP